MAGRRFIIGDIHSCYDRLERVLSEAGFNRDEDILYSVGDICDRGEKPVETIDFLMGLRNFLPVLGNHDEWLESFLFTKMSDIPWLSYNGGKRTVDEIRRQSEGWRKKVLMWISSFPVIRYGEDFIIVHGGIPGEYTEGEIEDIARRDRPHPLLNSSSFELEAFLWDRDYLYSAMYDLGMKQYYPYLRRKAVPLKTNRTIWIGHTPQKEGIPFFSEEYHLASIDTGSWFNRLTLVDMDSREYWQA